MHTNIYDLIIVGAGPSGLMLAHILRNSGIKILLIEKRETHKVTPAGIYGSFRSIIDRCELTKYIVAEHRGIQFFSPNVVINRQFNPAPFVTVDLDAWASEVELSCDTQYNTEITSMNKTESGYILNDTFEGKLIVDCTGHAQVLTSLLGMKKVNAQYYNCVFELENCTIPDDHNSDAGIGYGRSYSVMGPWFYCYSNSKAQFGIGDIINNTDKPTKDIVDRCKKGMEAKPFNEWFKDATITKTTVGIGPTLQIRKRLVEDNFICLGDAGGGGVPLIGLGIRYHFEMAHFVTDIIHEAVATQDFSRKRLVQYEKEFKRRYAWKFFLVKIGEIIFRKYLEPKDADLWIAHLGEMDTKDYYDAASSRADIRILKKLFPLSVWMRIFCNLINYHLPKPLRFRKHLEPPV